MHVHICKYIHEYICIYTHTLRKKIRKKVKRQLIKNRNIILKDMKKNLKSELVNQPFSRRNWIRFQETVK